MPKKQRITRKDFPHAKGMHRVAGEFFWALVAPASSPKSTCVVSKKVAALASERNLIKRRARAVLSGEMKSMRPFLVIMHAKREARGAKFSELRLDIRAILKKATQSG